MRRHEKKLEIPEITLIGGNLRDEFLDYPSPYAQ